MTPPSLALGTRRVEAERARDLPRRDVRIGRDLAVLRGWAAIGWKLWRLGVLASIDAAAALAAIFAIVVVGSAAPLLHLSRLTLEPTLTALLVAVQLLALGATGSYGQGIVRMDGSRVVRAVLLTGAMAFLHAFAATGRVAAGDALAGAVAYAGLGCLFILYGRHLVDRSLRALRRAGFGQSRVLVVGSAEQYRAAIEFFPAAEGGHLRAIGRLSTTHVAEPGALGSCAQLAEILGATGASGVLVNAHLPAEAFETLVNDAFACGAAVYVVPQTLGRGLARVRVRESEGQTLLDLGSPVPGFPQLVVKRTIDLVLSALGLLLISPALLVIAAAIKLDSRGPVFFRQKRAGVGGQPFGMLKFRTMVTDADRMKAELHHLNESGDPRLFKIRRDPRVTRVGRLLRRTSLDELPQLINVLCGEMSLVGPRPFFPNDLDGYADHHFERLFVLPGITGLWQVSGRSDVLDFEEVVRLDAEYIRKWSLALDAWILLRTIPAALGRGAY